jgi:hypothetical protein
MKRQFRNNAGLILTSVAVLWGSMCPAQQSMPVNGAQPTAQEPKPAVSPAGRRDPFNDPTPPKKIGGPELPKNLPPGKKGLVVGQLQLQGVARAVDGGWIAVVDNKTKRAYFLREKDELYNGYVSRITPESVTFIETNSDGAGKSSSREVVKKLTAE